MRRAFPILAWALIVIAGLILFNRAMDADARSLCFNEATATDAVCRQAGVIP